MTFGAFVEIAPGKEGLVHISKLDTKRVEKVEDVVAVGDELLVKVTEIDQQGRINLSRKDALADWLQSRSKEIQLPGPIRPRALPKRTVRQPRNQAAKQNRNAKRRRSGFEVPPKS